MKAVAYRKGAGKPEILEIDKPRPRTPRDVLFRVVEAGIDATDRNIVSNDLFDPERGDDFMLLGHEAVGVVEEVGPDVTRVSVGDVVVPTVRRGCGQCSNCLHGESDFCSTGLYTEHGIHGLRGYFTEFVVVDEAYLAKVPPELRHLAVLAEPLSICEKALEQVKVIQSRLLWSCSHPDHGYDKPGWGSCKRAMVIGAGPLGFLATALLRLEGMDTRVAEVLPEDHPRVKLVKELGAHYVNSSELDEDMRQRELGELDLILDASGAAAPALEMMTELSRNAIFVLTGIPRGSSEFCLDGNMLIRRIVRYNQVIVGSVNSNRRHFEMALADLKRLLEQYGETMNKVITARLPLEELGEAMVEQPRGIKEVLQIARRAAAA
ncbi:MAG: hypothetical protein C4521_00395 [Actinobacteria bacterium]|nr:MAG: hypothetical protein C4521_00395 [Actinomycetota bacterium]